MIKAVLFDIGNVMIRWDPEALYRKLIPDAAERTFFLKEVCTMDWHTRHDQGVSFADNRAPLFARWPQYADLVTAWDTRFEEMLGTPIAETESVIDDLLAKDVPIYGLTNMPAEKADLVFSKLRQHPQFRGTVISAHEGLIKPDAAIYRVTLERMGLAADEVFFTDDSAANIEMAQILGFDTWHFTDPAGLRPALERAGVL